MLLARWAIIVCTRRGLDHTTEPKNFNTLAKAKHNYTQPSRKLYWKMVKIICVRPWMSDTDFGKCEANTGKSLPCSKVRLRLCEILIKSELKTRYFLAYTFLVLISHGKYPFLRHFKPASSPPRERPPAHPPPIGYLLCSPRSPIRSWTSFHCPRRPAYRLH